MDKADETGSNGDAGDLTDWIEDLRECDDLFWVAAGVELGRNSGMGPGIVDIMYIQYLLMQAFVCLRLRLYFSFVSNEIE